MSNALADSVKRRGVSASAYAEICEFIYETAGISLGAGKQMLVSSRLNKRLAFHGLENYDQFVSLLKKPGNVLER